jgi:NAD(P)-dependent dehydrogenase (short-subunit alcohol dehydrogenase family)
VAFGTGAARGQGRSHPLRLAQEGADIIAVDICEQVATVAYEMPTKADLDETAAQVEALDRRIVARQADVRDRQKLQSAFDAGVADLGGCDIVLANAGIAPISISGYKVQEFYDVVDIHLTGVWNTVEVATQQVIDQGRGGAIVLTSSTAGLKGIAGDLPGGIGYTAAKHGVVDLMGSYANTP